MVFTSDYEFFINGVVMFIAQNIRICCLPVESASEIDEDLTYK